jgi:hypothetical protein
MSSRKSFICFRWKLKYVEYKMIYMLSVEVETCRVENNLYAFGGS